MRRPGGKRIQAPREPSRAAAARLAGGRRESDLQVDELLPRAPGDLADDRLGELLAAQGEVGEAREGLQQFFERISAHVLL